MPFRIKIRLMELGKKQKDLAPELRKRGIIASPSDISCALGGAFQQPKLDKILHASNEIVTEWEQEKEKEV